MWQFADSDVIALIAFGSLILLGVVTILLVIVGYLKIDR